MFDINFLEYKGHKQQCHFARCKNYSAYMLKRQDSPIGSEFRMCSECAENACKSIVTHFKEQKDIKDQAIIDKSVKK